MPHRQPLKNLLPPVPPFRLAGGPAALLVLDAQRFLLDPACGLGRLAAERGLEPELDEYYEQVAYAVTNTADLLAAFRSAGLQAIFTRLAAQAPAGRDRGQAAFGGWLPPPGDPAADFHPRLQPTVGETVLAKPTFSPFAGAALDAVLRALDVEHVVLTGSNAGYTIELTAREAADRGYGVLVVADACPCETFEIHGFVMRQLVGGLVRTRTTGEVLEMLAGART